MRLSAVLGAILLADFAREDSGSHLLLAVVVVGAHMVVVKESEEFLSMTP